jgi:hypothetical protein
MKMFPLLLLLALLQFKAFARKDSLFVYTELGIGFGTGQEFSIRLGADVIYKRHSFSFYYSPSFLPAAELPADYDPGRYVKHRGTPISYTSLFGLMYGRVWYVHKYARFILKGGVFAGEYTYPSHFVYVPPAGPGDTMKANYTHDFKSLPVFGLKLNPVLEMASPVVGGSLGLYAYANSVTTGAGVEFNFLLGKLRKKYNKK